MRIACSERIRTRFAGMRKGAQAGWTMNQPGAQ
jgi:hypothetical protein